MRSLCPSNPRGQARSISAAIVFALASAALPAATLPASAATTTNLVVTPLSTVFSGNNVTGVAADAAPGFDGGSLASNGVAKTDMYFTPAMLFGGPVTFGDIKDIRFWTKKGTTHPVEARDWYLILYSDPYVGDVSTPAWYGDRIVTEPAYSAALADPANTWNQWATDGATNTLRFYESTQGAPGAGFGSYTDPFWAAFSAGNALSGSPYAGHSILYFSIQTSSSTAAGFTGQLDGVTIELDDGSVATINFEPACTADADCETDGLFCTLDTCNTASGVCSSAPRDCSADVNPIDFEAPTYAAGNINGQDGWKKTGPFDHVVASSGGTAGYGLQSLRISNAVTSGSFGDQLFSRPVANEVGESGAASNGLSGGSRRMHFETSFDIVSAVPGAEQPGLSFSTSADRGDGARETYLRFADSPTGLQVYFLDYQDLPPYGDVGTEADGCGAGDNFFETQVGTDLDRSVPHAIVEILDVVEGPHNDVVKVFIDGNLVHTGTSWEDYHRWCAATGESVTVDSRLFRTAGTAAPATLGFGFLIDNFELKSGDTEGEICNDTCDETSDSCAIAGGTACTDDLNACTVDQCDGSGNCAHTAGNAGTICRSPFGVCDLAETCDGLATDCPADAKSSGECRASAGVCDVAESCDGISNACPADAKSVAVCRTAAGECDAAETCDGIADACPVDAYVALHTACTDDGDVCTVDSCDGAGACIHEAAECAFPSHPTKVKVRQQKDGDSRGKIRLRSGFLAEAPGDLFNSTNPITITVSDAATLSYAHTWTMAECLVKSSGAIRCLSADKAFRVMFKPVKGQPNEFRFRAMMKNLAIDGPFVAPVTVALEHGATPTSHQEEAGDCRLTAQGIRCRQ